MDWPHAQPPTWRARVFCQGVLPLATTSRYLKGAGCPPFAVVAQLQYNYITRVMTRTCDIRLGGRAYDTVGISRHLRSTPGGPSAFHQGPSPPFNPDAVNKPPKLFEGAGCISRGEGGGGGGIVVVLFCEKLPHLVIGNIPFQKGNEWACDDNSGRAFHKYLDQWSCACLYSFIIKCCSYQCQN